MRYEWFDDIDRAQIAPSPGPGVFHLLDFGGTHRFTEKFWVRPEFRWEWYDGVQVLVPDHSATARDQISLSPQSAY